MTEQGWRKSSFSGSQANCVEVGQARLVVLVRDTKDRTGPALRFTTETWSLFADQVKRSLALGTYWFADVREGRSRCSRGCSSA
jgi:Domain of unknown function (DUF397)